MAGETNLRTLLVGIDGACAGVLDPLFEAGDLPTLEEVLSAGASGPLPSQVPPWTPSAWPSLFTGTNPGKHGLFDFLAFDGYDWSVVDATRLRARPLWEHLDRHGLSSVVVNVPVTHPPNPFDGALVPGYTAPEDPPCHPPGVLDAVREAVGGYRVYPRDDSLAAYRAVVGARVGAFRHLADRFDPAFGFLQFQVTDTVVHEHPGDRAALAAVYRAVDEAVGAVLDACDPETVVVASDHGVGPYAGREFRVNEFLRRQGYLTAVRGGDGMPAWATVREERLKRGKTGGRDGRGPLAAAAAAAARLGLTAQRVGAALDAVGLADAVARRVPAGVVGAATEQVDFPASRAYARSRTECGVRVNLAGREPDGQVPAEDYGTIRDRLVADLAGVATPDGDPVFEDVAPREDYFHGPVAHRGPDVVTVPAAFDQFLSTRLAGDVFGEPSEPWNHKRDGVVAARGAGVDPDADLAGARLLDVAPTVLATLGVPADERMDGSVLPAAEPAGEASYPPYEPPRGGDEGDDSVERRLADLGYLE